jgi:hypothetical protein
MAGLAPLGELGLSLDRIVLGGALVPQGPAVVRGPVAPIARYTFGTFCSIPGAPRGTHRFPYLESTNTPNVARQPPR